MLAPFLRQFQRILVLQTAVVKARPQVLAIPNTRGLFQLEKATTKAETLSAPEAGDADYVVPYHAEREQRVTQNVFVDALSSRFRLSSTDIKRVLSDEVVNKAHRERSLVYAMEALCMEGVTKRSFVDNPWLIAIDAVRLNKKLAMLRTLPLRDINDFVPFLRLSVPRLQKLVAAMNAEADTVPESNRIYYISAKLQLSPYVVSKFLCKRLFVLEMPFDMLEQNLNNMINYNVSPMNIIKDLWAFRYTPNAVKLRLERVKRARRIKIMPWMVRCPESILQRTLKLTQDELAVLGEHKNVVEYVAQRLEFSVEDTKSIMSRHPQVFTVRVTKIKEVLDYLLNEVGFTRHEIAQVPRILCHSLQTTKKRLEELKSYGCRPSSLVIVCRSKKEYDKFVEAWKSMSIDKSKIAATAGNT